MSKITLAPNASGTGTLTVAAPNTNSDYTLTLPAETGTVLTSGGAIDVNASAPADSITISSTGQTKVSSSSNPALLVNRTSSTGDAGISFQSTGTTVAKITGIYGDGMIFHTGSAETERMRIDSSGNVGIGTSSPNTVSARTVLTVASAGAGGGEIDLTVGGTTALRVLTDGSYNTEFRNPQNSPLIFSTNNTERMRLSPSGYLMIGTGAVAASNSMLSMAGSVTWGVGPQIAGSTFYIYNPSNAGVYITSGANTWSSSSDETLKNITGEIQNGLEKVNSLRAAEFTWKSDETNTKQVGLIAQDVKAVLPEVITIAEEGGTLGVQYTNVIPLLVAAIKELSAKNDALEARIAALEAGNVPT